MRKGGRKGRKQGRSGRKQGRSGREEGREGRSKTGIQCGLNIFGGMQKTSQRIFQIITMINNVTNH